MSGDSLFHFSPSIYLVGGVNTIDRWARARHIDKFGVRALSGAGLEELLLAGWAGGMAVCNRAAGPDKIERTEVLRRRSRRRKASGLVF